MGNIVTWLVGIPIIAFGVYSLVKAIKKGVTGSGCDGCSGCDSSIKTNDCNH